MPPSLRTFVHLLLALNVLLMPLTQGQAAFTDRDTQMSSAPTTVDGCHHTRAAATDPGAKPACCCDEHGDPLGLTHHCNGQCDGHCASAGHGMAPLTGMRNVIRVMAPDKPAHTRNACPANTFVPAFRPPITRASV
ncbi:MAG: hypothetical protein H6980_09445 [Gammaproteobacteria bacterium]|nr:hypothetical protein [Gammaproteobacteria bacterium]